MFRQKAPKSPAQTPTKASSFCPILGINLRGYSDTLHRRIQEHEAIGDKVAVKQYALEAMRFDTWLWQHRQYCDPCEEAFVESGKKSAVIYGYVVGTKIAG